MVGKKPVDIRSLIVKPRQRKWLPGGLSTMKRKRLTTLLRAFPHMAERKAGSGKLVPRAEFRNTLRHFLHLDDVARQLAADLEERGSLTEDGEPRRAVELLLRTNLMISKLQVTLGMTSDAPDNGATGAEDGNLLRGLLEERE